VGAPFDSKIRGDVVYRLREAPQSPMKYPYLTVSDDISKPADILTVSDFRRVKERMKKKVKKGTGFEVKIAPARKMDAAAVGQWFEGVGEMYSFCHSSKCQFILSSGATSLHEMVSGQCFDAMLKNCGIDPERHWREMNNWLETKLSGRVTVYC
jgi:hypothetical protein